METTPAAPFDALPGFPVRLFTSVIVLSVLALGFFILGNVYDRRFANEDVPRLRKLTELSGAIVHLDEVLTMSARMASATGDPAWEARYREFEPKLDEAIKEARLLAVTLKSEDIRRTDEANTLLVDMEHRAFELVRLGRREEAAGILQGEKYAVQKAIYANGILALKRTLEQEADRAVENAGNRFFAEMIPIFVVLPLLVGTWYMTVRKIGLWRSAMVSLNTRVVERTAELEKLNRELDSRVADRTEGLRQSEERFRQLVAHLHDVFWMRSVDLSNVIYVSPAYEEIWGRSCASLEADPGSWKRAVSEGTRHDAESLFVQAAKGEMAVAEYEIERPDGSKRWIHDQAFPIKDIAGSVYRIGGMAEDITEKRNAEEMLRQSQKMQAIGRLAGGIAHDFNNLLTVILGYAAAVQEGFAEGSGGHADVSEIIKAGERASSLTRQLLVFSRKQVVQPRKLDLNTVISEMEKMLRRLIGEDIQFNAVLRQGLWTVRTDPSQIQQVVMNLVLNARDAMPDGGALTVETANVTLEAELSSRYGLAAGEYVLLAVTDTGSGMTPETRARLFEPFFTTKAPGQGTGLGLSTVYGIVSQSSGQVTVYTEVGKGSTFKVYFPRILEGQDSSPASTIASASRGRERLLVVEDEDMVRQLIKVRLAAQGYEIHVARNGVEALAIHAATPTRFDLVITDVVMPQLGGVELARRLAETSPGLRVLFMSGYPDGAIVQQGELPEETPFLQKPFATADLLCKVRATLDSPAMSLASLLQGQGPAAAVPKPARQQGELP
ncbi:MAG: ATP-binding protein [Planctomycetota bacterium]